MMSCFLGGVWTPLPPFVLKNHFTLYCTNAGHYIPAATQWTMTATLALELHHQVGGPEEGR